MNGHTLGHLASFPGAQMRRSDTWPENEASATIQLLGEREREYVNVKTHVNVNVNAKCVCMHGHSHPPHVSEALHALLSMIWQTYTSLKLTAIGCLTNTSCGSGFQLLIQKFLSICKGY